MPPRPKTVYWDANVFLALFQKGDHPDKAYQRKHSILWMEAARKGRYRVVTSALTLAEARRGENEPPLPGDEHATLRNYLRHEYIIVVPVDRVIGELAADYGEKYGLKPRDAIHLATAVQARVSMLLAWDNDFHKLKAQITAPIVIQKPEWDEQTQLALDAAGVFDEVNADEATDSI